MDIRKSSAVLDPSDVPYDITFVIDHCGSEVRAHKLIMAMGSPVCKKQFFGELKETTEEIVIKNTTINAFAVLVDTFYGKEIKWATKTAEELFEIADMAEKYQVEGLMRDVDEAMKEYPIKGEDVVEVAYIAEVYSRFKIPSQTLLQTCAKFLTSVLLVQKDFAAFSAKYSETAYAEVVLKLFALMEQVIPPLPSCCGLTKCRRGKPMMLLRDFVVGDIVKLNSVGTDLGVCGTVEKIYPISPRGEEVVNVEGYDYDVSYEGCANFFFCKC